MPAEKEIFSMKLKDIMTCDVEMVRPDETLVDAAKRMRKIDAGILPVCENDRIVGMITDRDIAVRAVADGIDPTTTKIRDVMSREVVYSFDDDDVRHAAELMRRKQVRRLLVLDRDKRVCGIVSLGDLAAESGRPKLMGEALADISETEHEEELEREVLGDVIAPLMVGTGAVVLAGALLLSSTRSEDIKRWFTRRESAA
jgi:CBS domain-containing protein